jgi:integrase
MAVYKEAKSNTWRVIYRYTDRTGTRKQSSKRGFITKREAQSWEREQLRKIKSDMDMTFSAFVELYTHDMKPRLRQTTWDGKENIIQKRIIPFFGNKQMNNTSAKDVIQWQNEMTNRCDKNNKPYSATYLKTMHNQLSAIFNHAVRYYDLKCNPAAKAGSIGKKEAKDMLFWTKDEYLKFADSMMDKPISYYAFEMLYWCGLRMGEMLALTPEDFDFEKATVSISKSYQRLKGQDIISEPKTPKSNRIIKMPEFLCLEIQDYLKSFYGQENDERMFLITKSYLHHEMDRGSKQSGVKRIRVHDLRHSHVSLLIEMGFSAVAIADRVGHESIDITYRYAHMFPSKQEEMANKLDIERGEGF